MELATNTSSQKYSNIFEFLSVLERLGRLNRLSTRVPWLSASALKEEAIQRARWVNLLKIRINLSTRLRSSLCA